MVCAMIWVNLRNSDDASMVNWVPEVGTVSGVVGEDTNVPAVHTLEELGWLRECSWTSSEDGLADGDIADSIRGGGDGEAIDNRRWGVVVIQNDARGQQHVLDAATGAAEFECSVSERSLTRLKLLFQSSAMDWCWLLTPFNLLGFSCPSGARLS